MNLNENDEKHFNRMCKICNATKIKYFSNKPYTFNSSIANSASVWTRMCETKDGEGGSELPLFPFFKGVGKYLIYLLTVNLRFP